MKHGYIFDCYGTLVEPISNDGAKAFLKYVDDKQRRIHRLMTTPTSIQEHLHTQGFSYVPVYIKNEIISLLQHDTTTLYPDAIAMIQHCITRDIAFCILSNLSADYKDNINRLIVKPYQESYDQLFKIFYSCDIGYQKPESEAYNLAVDFLQQQGVEHITMIGDNPKYDYLKPKELGIHALWLNRNNKSHDYSPTEVITSFDELVSH